MFRITEGKGFQIVFENGYEISVQFGYHNYSQNNGDLTKATPYLGSPSGPYFECQDAEIAIFDQNECFVTKQLWPLIFVCEEGAVDDVVGYATPEHVAYVIAFLSTYTPPKKEEESC